MAILDVTEIIKQKNLKCIDMLNFGGAIWVNGGTELSPIMLGIHRSDFHFTYKAGGGRSSDFKDAWWYKSS